MLKRVITEGSTIIMEAFNADSSKQLKKVVGCAPCGKREMWMLNIQDGTQSISPLLRSIETGSLDAAKTIFVDLLAIRADRERYYYGMGLMFGRHADILKILSIDARDLLPVVFAELISVSRVTDNGQRCVTTTSDIY